MTTTTVSPRADRSVTDRPRGSGRSRAAAWHTSTARPPTVPETPTPGIDRRSVPAIQASGAASRMASAIGWVFSASTAAASVRTSSERTPGVVITVDTTARCSVRVPVLSKTTVSTWARRSSASPLRMKMPSAEARPQPTIMATGAARPIAHGQATSRTATPLRTAWPRSPTTSHQTAKVTAEVTRTAGTKTLLMRSAIRCSGALSRWASSTSLWRWARTDSVAIVVTLTTRVALPLRVPPVTALPGPRSTGSGSPVSIDSSTADHPWTTSPSRGMASPGRTRTRASSGTLSGATSSPWSSSTPTTTRAVGGRRLSSECRAAPARLRTRASMARPVTKMATISGAMTPWSRAANAPLPPRWRCRPPRAIASTALTARAARVPKAMRVSMLVAPCTASRALLRRNGHPPASSTVTARSRTTHPARGSSGATSATRRAARASGQEMRARTLQWSGSAELGPRSVGATGDAEYPAPSTAAHRSSASSAAGS